MFGPPFSNRLAAYRRAALLSALGASACVPEFDDQPSLVRGDTLLALRAEPAEAAEGAPVSLSALQSGDGQVAFDLCLARKSLTELGPIDTQCLSHGRALERIGRGSVVSTLVPKDACSLFGPRRPEPEPGHPAGRPVDPDLSGGYYQPFLASLPDGEFTLGAVRLDCGLAGADREQVIEYTARHRPNSNVEVERLELRQGGAWVRLDGERASRVRRGTEVDLRVRWADCDQSAAECDSDAGACAPSGGGCTGAETYVFFDPETRSIVERQEHVVATWYTTHGDFADHRSLAEGAANSAENRWMAPPGRTLATLWVVLRDGRGGVGWAQVRVEVE